ncbi:MAG TPA: alpha-amylase family glycosyl hydrolase [Candidatus Limnocylindrales bacterium]|nr:alpha-amylase family glycosyl hydrolase [Candidatus Limnocylindrales bacterium]
MAGCSPAPSPPTSAGPSPSATVPASSSAASPVGAAPTCPPLGAQPSGAIPAALGRPGWWRGRVFYEIFVRSFADSDGDGIGDLRGATARLDHLNDGDPATTSDLGITGIWLMPIAESPSYHGYDVTDETAVEADYGTLADLRAFVAAAHERGIAVVTDLVLNHTSNQHPWFRESDAGTGRQDWYVWSDTDPGYGGPDGQMVWHPSGGRWYYGLFGRGLPDLNVANPAVAAEMAMVARFWLEDVGIDGFRLDAIKHLIEDGRNQVHTEATHRWLGDFRDGIHAYAPDALLVGEVYDLSVAVARYVPEDVDLAFDFDRAQATIDSIRRGDAAALLSVLAEDAELFGADETAGFLTNHDQSRIASQLREDPAALRLAAGLLLTGAGTPFLYYGEEIGLTGEKPDELIRTPMPWTGDGPAAGFTTGTPWEPLAAGWETRNVAAQVDDPGSLLAAYRDLIDLRASQPALALGTSVPLESSDTAVAAFLRARADGPGRVVVVANVADRAVAAPALELVDGPLCGTSTARVVYRTGISTPADLAVAAPTINPSGGLGPWTPFPELPPRSVTVIDLGG